MGLDYTHNIGHGRIIITIVDTGYADVDGQENRMIILTLQVVCFTTNDTDWLKRFTRICKIVTARIRAIAK